MEQWLPRGTTVKAEKRIKKMISSGKDWQIYSTNQDTYVLVATTPLYEKWGADYLLPKGIFDQLSDMNDLWIYCSSGHYIVSSLEQGPYPENNGQIEAFSIAFNTTLRLYPQADLHDAVYIEEYSLILPGDEKPSPSQNDNVYGLCLFLELSQKLEDRRTFLLTLSFRSVFLECRCKSITISRLKEHEIAETTAS